MDNFEKKEKVVPWIETCKQPLLRKCKVPRWEANR